MKHELSFMSKPDQVTINEKSESVVHLLPCSIDYSGPANVSSFFKVQTKRKRTRKSGEEEVFSSHFRGRLLHGIEYSLPQPVVGHYSSSLSSSGRCFIESPMDASSDISSNKVLRVDDVFHSLVVWDHDKDPDERISLLDESLLWLQVAKEVKF